MDILNIKSLKYNKQIKINFNGGDLSSAFTKMMKIFHRLFFRFNAKCEKLCILQLVLDEFLQDYRNISLVLRGDSEFATLDLYKQCEMNGISYVIRLKNGVRILKYLEVL